MWQKCPICDGSGTKGFTTIKCDACNGMKIINQLTGLPPVVKNTSSLSNVDAIINQSFNRYNEHDFRDVNIETQQEYFRK